MRRLESNSLALLLALCGGPLAAGCAHEAPAPTLKASAAAPVGRPSPVILVSPSAPHVVATESGFNLTDPLEFTANKSELGPAAERLLAEIALVMKDNPSLLEVYIAGFASSDGDPHRNEHLALDRAQGVRSWLIAHGVAADRLQAGGFGADLPVGDNDSKVGRQLNRRTDFIAARYIVNGAVVEGNVPGILKETRETARN